VCCEFFVIRVNQNDAGDQLGSLKCQRLYQQTAPAVSDDNAGSATCSPDHRCEIINLTIDRWQPGHAIAAAEPGTIVSHHVRLGGERSDDWGPVDRGSARTSFQDDSRATAPSFDPAQRSAREW